MNNIAWPTQQKKNLEVQELTLHMWYQDGRHSLFPFKFPCAILAFPNIWAKLYLL